MLEGCRKCAVSRIICHCVLDLSRMEIDMLSNAKIALSLALVATASGAMAAPKHAVRHHSARAHSAVAWQMPATSCQELWINDRFAPGGKADIHE